MIGLATKAATWRRVEAPFELSAYIFILDHDDRRRREHRRRQNDLKMLFGDDAGAVEGVVEPEVGGEGMVSCCGDDAVFEEVAGFEAEDADGFDADVVVGGEVDDGGIGIVGDGAGENVGDAAAGVGDSNQRNFDGLEAAIEIEIEAGELADA